MHRPGCMRDAAARLALLVLLLSAADRLSLAAGQQEEVLLPQEESPAADAAAAAAELAASSAPSSPEVETTSPPQAADASDPFTSRQTVYLRMGGKKKNTFPLRFPRLPPLPGDVPTYLRLNLTDTCGLFTLFHTIRQAAGWGPPPHIHYAEDEYFISAGTGSTRVFTNQKATNLKPGRLPGFNMPPIEVGSTLMNGSGSGNKFGGQLLLSPAGNIHYFERITDVTHFFTVYLDGFADAAIIEYVLYGNPQPRELLLFSGLYGIPTDMTGAFVKGCNDSSGTQQLYRNPRGPIDVPNPLGAARRLQKLFDYVEEHRCCKACL